MQGGLPWPSGYHYSPLLSLDKHMPQAMSRHLILHSDLFLVSSFSSNASRSCTPQQHSSNIAPFYKERKQGGGSREVIEELIWGLAT